VAGWQGQVMVLDTQFCIHRGDHTHIFDKNHHILQYVLPFCFDNTRDNTTDYKICQVATGCNRSRYLRIFKLRQDATGKLRTVLSHADVRSNARAVIGKRSPLGEPTSQHFLTPLIEREH